jgi:hypothetical protein
MESILISGWIISIGSVQTFWLAVKSDIGSQKVGCNKSFYTQDHKFLIRRFEYFT